MKTKILSDFQTSISAPLMKLEKCITGDANQILSIFAKLCLTFIFFDQRAL